MSERQKDEVRKQRLKVMKRRQILLIVTFILTIVSLAVVIIISNKSEDDAKSHLIQEEKVETNLSSLENVEEVVSEEETSPSLETVTETESPVESVSIEETEEVIETETSLETVTETEIVTETEPVPETEVVTEPAATANVQGDRFYIPTWVTQDFLTPSQYNRPYEALDTVNNVVIHYVGNPGSTAKGNRDYFENLSNPQVNPTGHGASSHFVVGLEGEIIQCIPVKEVAFANYPRNYDTISIEVCHPDEEGKFNDVTYASVVRLSAYVLEELNLTADALIRHHDVTGKYCPMYYVVHEDAWIQFKEDVRAYMAAHPDIETEMP